MRNFKRFLKEEIDTSHFLKTEEEIKDRLGKTTNSFHINPDLTVDWFWHQGLKVSNVEHLNDGYFPCQFSSAKSFYINEPVRIKSLVGSPTKVSESCEIRIGRTSYLRTLEGCPKEVGEVFKVVDFTGQISTIKGITSSASTYRNYLQGVTSYQNVHKEIKHIGSIIEIMSSVDSNMLGFALIPSHFWIVCGVSSNSDSDLRKGLEILNRYTMGKEKDLLGCKEELMENNLKDFAKL